MGDLIRLRQNPGFRAALDDLLECKRTQIRMIILSHGRQSAMAAATRDFDRLTRAYAEAMDSEGHRKAGTVASTFFGLATGEFLGVI